MDCELKWKKTVFVVRSHACTCVVLLSVYLNMWPRYDTGWS